MSFHFPPATFDFVSLTNNLNKFFIFIFMCFPVVVAAYLILVFIYLFLFLFLMRKYKHIFIMVSKIGLNWQVRPVQL
jgi:hypothetical protein